MTAAAPPGSDGSTSTLPTEDRPFRLLHISDLHIGWNFQIARWEDLLQVCRKQRPDLIVITGDLVNTPWRWLIPKVRAKLNQLATHSGSEDPTVPVWTVPGNHDTRLSGVFPVGWLSPTALIAACAGALTLLFAVASPTASWASLLSWVGLIAFLVMSLALLLRLLTVRDLARAIGEPYFLDHARLTPCARVGVLPLDSATSDVSWARGRISSRELASINAQLDGVSTPDGSHRSAIWIALVHHHLLPIPHDAQHERMMVMDNAGALLSTLTARGIRLVLHGHKHHQHFSRIVIDSSMSPYAELAVLAASTPTEGRRAGVFRHGFNLVSIDADNKVLITPYEAEPDDGIFKPGKPFHLVPPEQHARDHFLSNAAQLPMTCRQMLCSADINPYGDARFVREFRDLRASRELAISRLEHPFVAEAPRGMVEAYVADSLSPDGPSVIAETRRVSLHRMEAVIEFHGDLRGDAGPIDFATEFHATNAFALTQAQHRLMYGGGTADGDLPKRHKAPEEELSCCTPSDMALAGLAFHIRFPERHAMPRRINVRWKREEDAAWMMIPKDAILRIESQNEVHVRINHPRPATVYEVRWSLNGAPSLPTEATRDRAIQLSERLRSRLAALQSDTVPEALKDLLAGVAKEASRVLGDGGDELAYDVSLFSFDARSSTLRYLLGSHADLDPRRHGRYAYGLGTVGRAFKSATPAAFRCPAADPDQQPWGYVLPDGRPVTQRSEVPEMAILALPLAPVDAPFAPFGVLQISTDDANRWLKITDSAVDRSVATFAAAVLDITPDIERIISVPKR